MPNSVSESLINEEGRVEPSGDDMFDKVDTQWVLRLAIHSMLGVFVILVVVLTLTAQDWMPAASSHTRPFVNRVLL